MTRAGPLLLLGVLAALLLGPAQGLGPCAKEPLGCEAWAMRYDGPVSGLDDAGALALSPDGARAFVTGHSLDDPDFDAATLAYDVMTGQQLWAARYDGFDGQYDEGTAVAASPDGASVFAAAYGVGDGTADDMVVVAYDAASGAPRWAARYNGPGNFQDRALAIAVAPDGAQVYAAGMSTGVGTSWDATVLALDPATGALAWVARLDGPAHGEDRAHAVAVSPDGARVFLGAVSAGAGGRDDLLVAALDAPTGATLWEALLPGLHDREDRGVALGVAPAGDAVFVAGSVTGPGLVSDFLTASLDAATGAARWVERYDHGPGSDDKPAGLSVTPDGSRVVVTGTSVGKQSTEDAVTVAYDAATGARAWVALYDGPSRREDSANAIAMSPDGLLVAVAGESTGVPPGGVHVALLGVGVGAALDYITLLYDPADGRLERELRYAGPGNAPDRARGVAFTPGGGRLLVTGHSHGGAVGYDYATVAYDLLPLTAVG